MILGLFHALQPDLQIHPCCVQGRQQVGQQQLLCQLAAPEAAAAAAAPALQLFWLLESQRLRALVYSWPTRRASAQHCGYAMGAPAAAAPES
jgi:hypothetical protein